jgi:hypothetical protein
MSATDRCRIDDFPLDELHPVIFGKNAGFAHAMVLLDGDPVTARKRFGIDIHDGPPEESG